MLLRLLSRRASPESEWISISDLMAGLMMIFLFIAISFMNNLQIRAEQVREIVVAYQELQDGLYEELSEEFRDDLANWQATIDRETLSVRFEEPTVLFPQGSAQVTARFATILTDFFPRYLRIIRLDTYREYIEEIRIEGHTSSEWQVDVDEETAYFENMNLSQDRTRAVLRLCLSLVSNPEDRTWARRFITANGLSSSRPMLLPNSDDEDPEASRRVEFRTRTAAEQKVVEIIREIEKLGYAAP